MPKSFSYGFKSRPFRLAIERVVRVRGIDNLSQKDKRRIIRKLVLLEDGFE